ncbi:MAG: STAS domain-containing protein [Bacteroidetes bacterium]|nr:STAS domain-containing protein [Bacteroidota bacterium]MBL6963818.1 STAS domain-containing protein [Bacteroidota bacterium]
MEKTPILKFGDTLIVSIQTELHDKAASRLQEDILNQVQKNNSQAVVIDVSSLEIVDSFIGRMLSNTAEMAALMHASVILVGISPAVSITLVELGLNLGGVKTALDLESAMELLQNDKASFFGSEKLDSQADNADEISKDAS